MATKKSNKKRGRDAEFPAVPKSKRKTAKKMPKEFASCHEDEKETRIPIQRESFPAPDLKKNSKKDRSSCSLRSKKTVTCESLRKRGNELYCQVSNGHYGPCLLRHKLEKARELYEEALDSASCGDLSENASCYKNLGAVNWVWGKAEWEIYMNEEEEGNEALKAIRAAKCLISKCVESYLMAVQYGKFKPAEWLRQVEDSLKRIIDWVNEQLCTYTTCFEPILVELCGLMENAGSSGSTSCPSGKKLGAVLYKIYIEFLFKKGIKCIKDDDPKLGLEVECGYKQCLSSMRDCYLPLNKGEAIVISTGDSELIKEFETIKEQILLYQSICESVQARYQGDDILKKALLDDEVISMELVWDAIDWYKHSILLSRYKDLESEAISLSRIGKIFSAVLKLKKQAHHYHFESTRIALAIMSPRIANSEWYKYSSEKVSEHQKNLVEEEKREYNERHEHDAKRIQEKISEIKLQGEKNPESFLRFIYSVHTHPDPKRRLLGSLSSKENVKACLRKAIVSYHPDNNGKYDRDWEVLCEEITKILNCKYGIYKCGVLYE